MEYFSLEGKYPFLLYPLEVSFYLIACGMSVALDPRDFGLQWTTSGGTSGHALTEGCFLS
jgi:hypothetical protein